MSKPKVIKDYAKLEDDLKYKLKEAFPRGFDKHLVTFKNHKRKIISALPYENEEFCYYIKMTREQAHAIYQGLGEYAPVVNDKADDKSDAEEEDIINEIEENAPSEVPEEMDS